MPRLTIIGPNLLDQSKGSFHVHNSACRDISKYHECEAKYDEDHANLQSIVESVYADIIDEDPDSTWEDLVGEFHIMPCVKL